MNEQTLYSLLITIGIEFVVLMVLVGGFFLFRGLKNKKADRNAAQELVAAVTGNEQSRREGLIKVFGECYEMEEDELNAAVDEFLNREKAFYKTLISVYVDRDAEKFSKLSGALEEMVKPYSDLALSVDVSADTGELEILQQQNQELSKELEDSKQVMDELLSEYNATFNKELEADVTTPAQEASDTPATEELAEPVAEESSESDSAEEPVEDVDLEGTVELSVDEFVENTEADDSVSEEAVEASETAGAAISDKETEPVNNEVSLDEIDEELETV